MIGGAPKAPKCSLGKLHTTRLGARDAAREGYRNTGVIVFFPDQLTDPFEREFVNRIASRLYGVKAVQQDRRRLK